MVLQVNSKLIEEVFNRHFLGESHTRRVKFKLKTATSEVLSHFDQLFLQNPNKLLIDIQEPFFETHGNIVVVELNVTFCLKHPVDVDEMFVTRSLKKIGHLLDQLVFFLILVVQRFFNQGKRVLGQSLSQLSERVTFRHLNHKFFLHFQLN
jgi:hypothetical protein